ncbi:MAG: YdiU family protein [Caenibius sp.]
MRWNFDNSYARDLVDFYAPWKLTPAKEPRLLLFNTSLANRLGLAPDPNGENGDTLADVFAGGTLPQGAEPIALAYAGHQFGHFSPQLGDGRALLLGEHLAPDGARFDIQLKGSGPTPFSRNGDGRSAIGPALREYLVSEAMAAMGVPTTRALAVATTGEKVFRQKTHPGAVMTRVAASHIRVGTFQYFAAHMGTDHVRRLADYTIARHYPDAAGAENPYLALLERVMDRQASLVAQWVNLGFIHGVMNTDNVAISGETLDYGPCAFMDRYAPETVFSSIDEHGRYAYGQQPLICRWNMVQLGQALIGAIMQIDEAGGLDATNALLESFPDRYAAHWLSGMQEKLGLGSPEANDLDLVNRLFSAMEGQQVDFTLFFRELAKVPDKDPESIRALFVNPQAIDPWLTDWQARLEKDTLPAGERRAAMDAVNPLYIPRNHKVEEALAAAEVGDMAPFHALLDVVTQPFTEREGLESYSQPAPDDFGPYVTFCGT